MSGTWLNGDGLYVKFGTSEDTNAVTAGEVMDTHGGFHEYVIDFSFDDLAAVGTEGILNDTVTIPANHRLHSADLYVITAFVGATGTLDLGLIDQDRSTAIDANGIDAAIAVAALTAGATIACNGALVGTKLTNTGLVTATNGTADFTAGRARLVIKTFAQS